MRHDRRTIAGRSILSSNIIASYGQVDMWHFALIVNRVVLRRVAAIATEIIVRNYRVVTITKIAVISPIGYRVANE